MIRWVFDLDGTLMDTREAVKHAYLLAGVRMPNDAWGKPWREWTTKDVHDKKNAMYPIALHNFASPLPLLDYAVKLRSHILTAASLDAVLALKQVGWLPARTPFTSELSREQKVDWLRHHGWGVYVDDDSETRTLAKERTTWKILTPQEAVATLQLSS